MELPILSDENVRGLTLDSEQDRIVTSVHLSFSERPGTLFAGRAPPPAAVDRIKNGVSVFRG